MSKPKKSGKTENDMISEQFPMAGNAVVSPYCDHSDPPWNVINNYYFNIVQYFLKVAKSLKKDPPAGWLNIIEAGQIFYDSEGNPTDIRLRVLSNEPYDAVKEKNIERIYDIIQQLKNPDCRPAMVLYRWHTEPPPKLEIVLDKSYAIRPFPRDTRKNHYSMYRFNYPGLFPLENPPIAIGQMLTAWNFKEVKDIQLLPPLLSYMINQTYCKPMPLK